MLVVARLLLGAEVVVIACVLWLAACSTLALRAANLERARASAVRALLAWLASTLVALLACIAWLVQAFHAVSGDAVDPSQKARVLAQGISEAMNTVAFGGAVTTVPGIVALVVLLRARSAAARTGRASGRGVEPGGTEGRPADS